MENNEKGVSFIIPAKNEEKNIAVTIIAIKENVDNIAFEIIVIDHNSSDNTAVIAKSLGAIVFVKSGGTIAAVRNYGASFAQYEIIVFIDADVSVTREWASEISKTLELIYADYKYVTGSHCVPPQNGNWIEEYRYKKESYTQHEKTAHLGSGHLIISCRLFNDLGGFNESLMTGEDYDICQRIKSEGAILINNTKLLVVHRDYPQNLKEFIVREMWHGSGDFQSVSIFFSSKVAIASVVQFLMHIMLIILLFLPSPTLLIVTLSCVVALNTLSSINKYKNAGFITIFVNVYLFYIYYWARLASLFYLLIKKNK